MGKKYRLDDQTAKELGLTPKKRQKSEKNSNPKYYLNKNREEQLKLIRAKGLLESCENHKVHAENVPYLWKKDKESSVFIRNPLYVTPIEKTYLDLRNELIEDLQKFSPKFDKIKRKQLKDAHLLVIDPADIHIGKLSRAFETGEEYNTQIAVKRVLEGVNGILDKCQGFNIDQILFIGGNDILHIDTPKRTTTSGTPQDTDGMWYDNFLIAKKLYIEVLQILLSVADVHFTFNPSNHDYTNGFFLADVIQTYFKDCKNITFDCSISHRKYYKYHNNLIGTTHGDGAKQDILPMLMAQESKDWSDTKHRYVYTHHVHHKTSKDYPGVTIESLRSPSGTDSWHHRNGHQHAPKAVEGFLHHKKNGQIARLTHLF
ncbi:MAG: hypothetical protein HRU26_05750 [Psychroserpens sp.]|nr:hypothetical protein [Psychroserpens sp.]